MDRPSSKLARAAALYVRVALATAFLSAVADRFGAWGPPGSRGVAWGSFGNFLTYTRSLIPFMPHEMVTPSGGW